MKKQPESLKILLVQNKPAIAGLVQQWLQEAVDFSYYLIQITRLEAAIAYLRTEPVDVVLLELSLADAQGLMAVSQVRNIAPDVPIVVTCDRKNEAEARQALQSGAQEYLITEQTTTDLLLRTLRYTIERQSLSKELQQTKFALQQQKQSYHLLTEIALRIRESLHLNDILQAAVTEVRQFLQTDRVMIYRICPEDQIGVLVAESIAPSCHVKSEFCEMHRIWFKPVETDWDKECLWVVNDVYQHNYSNEYLELMMKLDIAAKLVVPIVHNDQPWGLLVVHQCHEPRQWQPEEINLLKQLAIQTAIAIQQSELYEQVKLLNTNLEQQVQERTQQLATEKALTEQILHSIQEGIFVMRPDGQVILTNSAFSQIYGLELPDNQTYLQEYLSRLQLRNPDGSYPNLDELPINRTIRGEDYTDHQLIVSCPNKEQKWVSISGAAVRDQDGNIILAVTTTRDITLAKQIEIALKDSEARFRYLSEASFEGIMVHEQGVILDANQSLAAMFGYEVSELIGKNAFELSLATPESLELIRKNIRSGYDKSYEIVGIKRDGSTFPVEIQGKVIPYQGRLVQVGTLKDISDRKHSETKLILYREIIANSNDAIVILNPQGHIIEQNAAHRILSGYSDEELLGQTPKILESEKSESFAVAFSKKQRDGNYRGELTIRTKSGALIDVELSSFAVQEPTDTMPLCYVSFVRDVTQRKQTEADLKQRDRLLEGVAAATNHLLTTKDFATGMTLALSTLGKAYNVDRVFICENSLTPHTREPLLSQRFEWTNSTVKTVIDNPQLQNLPYNFFSPHWYERLQTGKTVHELTQASPEPARKMLEEMEVVSMLLVPILLEGEFWGFMGFDDCHRERQWTETEQATFMAAAGSIGGAIIRKRTEEALRKSEAKNYALLNAIPDLILRIGKNGTLLDSKSSDSYVLGSQFLGKQLATVMPSAVTQQMISAMEQALASDVTQVIEFQMPINGKLHDYEARIVVSGEEEVLSIVRDISDRKQAEAALHAKERQLRRQSQTLMQLARYKTFERSNLNAALKEITEAAAHTLEVQRTSVWLYTSDRSQLTCIDLYEQNTGHSSLSLQLAAENYLAYFQALHQERTIAVNNALVDPRTQELSESYLSVIGITSMLDAPIWLEGQILGVVCHEHVGSRRQWTLEEQNFAGSIADFVSLAIEANNRQRTQEILRQSEARFRAIFDNSGIGIAVANLDRQIIDCNLALSLVLGYTQDELRQMSCADYTHPDDISVDFEPFQQLFAGERDHYEIEKRCLRKDGRVVWVRLTVSIVPDRVGKTQFAIGMMQDITEGKQAEIKLRESKEAAEAGSRAKSEFLATMSHELRTPLNAILGLSQLLQQEIFGTLSVKQREYVDFIYGSGEHLLALIDDILDLSKVEAGREELILTPLEVRKLCDYCIGIVSDRALAKNLQLTSQIDPQVDVCIADERRIKQMLLNLLSNAIKFTHQGSVSLCVEKVPQGIAFKVSDTGIGIAPEHLKLLFQPFKQLDSRLNRQYEGTGLGLALTQKLARLHGGDVTVQSTLGKGSQFTLLLPSNSPE